MLILMSALRSVGQQRALALAQLNVKTAVMVVWHTRALVMFASNSTDSGNESCSLLGAMPLLGATQREIKKKKKNSVPSKLVYLTSGTLACEDGHTVNGFPDGANELMFAVKRTKASQVLKRAQQYRAEKFQ